MDINQIVTTAIEKSKKNPQFSDDLMKYIQYLTLSTCPTDKTEELKQILQRGNMKNLLEFGTLHIPHCNEQILEYINEY